MTTNAFDTLAQALGMRAILIAKDFLSQEDYYEALVGDSHHYGQQRRDPVVAT